MQRIRSERVEDNRVLEGVRAELAAAQRGIVEASSTQDKLRRETAHLCEQLADKDKQISAVRYTVTSSVWKPWSCKILII